MGELDCVSLGDEDGLGELEGLGDEDGLGEGEVVGVEEPLGLGLVDGLEVGVPDTQPAEFDGPEPDEPFLCPPTPG